MVRMKYMLKANNKDTRTMSPKVDSLLNLLTENKPKSKYISQ